MDSITKKLLRITGSTVLVTSIVILSSWIAMRYGQENSKEVEQTKEVYVLKELSPSLPMIDSKECDEYIDMIENVDNQVIEAGEDIDYAKKVEEAASSFLECIDDYLN